MKNKGVTALYLSPTEVQLLQTFFCNRTYNPKERYGARVFIPLKTASVDKGVLKLFNGAHQLDLNRLADDSASGGYTIEKQGKKYSVRKN